MVDEQEKGQASQSELEANLSAKIRDLDTQNDQLLKDVSHFKAQAVSQTSTISSLEQEIDSLKGKQTEWQDHHKEQLG